MVRALILLASPLNLAGLVLTIWKKLASNTPVLKTRSLLVRWTNRPLLLLHLLETLLITLLRTLLTAITLEALLNLLIMTVTRTPSAWNLLRRLLTPPALGMKQVGWTKSR